MKRFESSCFQRVLRSIKLTELRPQIAQRFKDSSRESERAMRVPNIKNRNWVASLLTCLVISGYAGAQELNAESFRKLHAAINPQAEAWKQIPWETDLIKAQNMAAAAKKPITLA